MSSYSFQGSSRIWTPRDEEENRAIFSAQKQEHCIKIEVPSEISPIYLSSEYEAEHKSEKWSLKQLIRLLRLYGAHRCLWDTRDPDNRNRKLRKAALVDITAAMGGGLRCAQVVQKINVLRSTYRYEKRRIKQRIRKGIGAKTKLKWFALADAFLRDVPRTEKFRKVEDMDSDSDLEDAVVFTIDPESLIPLEDDEEYNCVDNVIKKEIVEHSTLTDEEVVPILTNIPNAAEISIKVENLEENSAHSQTVDYSHMKPLKPSWTAQDSLQFVQLLGQHEILWKSKTQHLNATTAQQEALQAIANAMQMPIKRIEKRVSTFCSVCEEEMLKITQNANYKPNFVWWSEAAKFMENNNANKLEEQHFVDANELPPPTPINSQLLQKSSGEVSFSKDVTDNEEIEETNNEIESAETGSVNMEQIDDDASKHADIELTEVADDQEPSNTKTSTTKLIWNGLEEDLLGGKWSLKHSVKFLRLYGAHRCLWDLNDPDYRSRELRNAAIEDIAAAMGYGLDADYVARKIKIFRITYMQHRKRMLEAIKQGKEPEIQLRWFPLADSFLRPHIGLRSIKENEREMPQFDLQYVYANLNLIDPALLTDFRGKGTQNIIKIGAETLPEEGSKNEMIL